MSLLMVTTIAVAQAIDLEGSWNGTLSDGTETLRLTFNIDQTDDGYSGSIVSVDQGGAVLPVAISVDGNLLEFTNSEYDIHYRAEVSGNQMTGTFTQFGQTFPGFKLVKQ